MSFVFVLLAGAFLPIADFFIVNVALPTIDVDLGASPASLELVVSVYGIAYAAMLVLGGRLGDRYGRHTLFRLGLAGFVLASLACGMAPTIGFLVAARLVQGVTAAALVPQVLATFHTALEGPRKVRALALYGATSGIAAVVGQLAGGLLVSADIAGLSWRPIFLVNVPIGLAALIAARIVPANRSPYPVAIDLVGTTLFAATLTALLLPLTEGQASGWPSWTWLSLAAAVFLAVVTVAVAERAETAGHVPLLPPSLLKLPSMRKGLTMIGLYSIGFGAFMFVFALVVQDGLRNDALEGGLSILPMAVFFFLGSVFSTRLIDRFGRGAMAVGGTIQAAGLAALILVVTTGWPDVSLWSLALPLVLVGGGQSMLFSGLFRVVLTDVPAHLGGVGSGVLITVQQASLALGVATLGTVYVTMSTTSVPAAFATAIGTQLAIVALLVATLRILPRFTSTTSAAQPTPVEV
ncbi:MFS transporter [Antribacter sp. KLBMP9083]|uniref:MFS transporter n=1 Tax=Antribacter soli TaxID=2910976 RepID=A0AA41QF15_9MICO|nr:MFS transporter [Antribacter soli]MCF4121943.1 MFS transporter [Antribacter soli]